MALTNTFTVLGGSGFIGSALVTHLRAQGHEVHVPARDAADLYTRELGHVIYAIGLTADFRTRPFDTMRAHLSLLADLLERARFDSLLYLSSTRVYGRSASGRESDDLVVNPNDASDLYNLSKLAGESLCLHGGRRGVRVARLSNVLGRDTGSQNFVFELMREALAGRIVLRSAPDSAKDYVLIDDVLALLPRIAQQGRHSLYNLASGRDLSHRAICTELTRLAGCDVEVAPDAPRLHFAPVDIARIREEFGFVPRDVLSQLPALLDSFTAAVA